MTGCLYAISILWISIAVCVILYTEQARGMLATFSSGVNLKIGAGLQVLLGVLLISASPLTEHPGLVIFIGIAAMAKGIAILVNPKNLTAGLLDWYLLRTSDQTYRLMGIVLLILGVSLLSWIR